MNKKITALAVIMITGMSFAFANVSNDPSGKNIRRNNEPHKIRNKENNIGIYQECFTESGKIWNAFYNQQGELIAVTRNILSGELPGFLQKELKEKYSSYWITELFELSGAQESTYYISLENADETIVLQSADRSHWTLYRKSGKSNS